MLAISRNLTRLFEALNEKLTVCNWPLCRALHCQNETIRQHYDWHLFDCVKSQLETKVAETNQQTPQEPFRLDLVNEIAQVMAKMRERKEISDELCNYQSQLAYYQSDYKKVKWTTVRLIKSTEFLIISLFVYLVLTTMQKVSLSRDSPVIIQQTKADDENADCRQGIGARNGDHHYGRHQVNRASDQCAYWLACANRGKTGF